MFVVYLADCSEGSWEHAKYPEAGDKPIEDSRQVESWIEKRAIEALKHKRRVWVYWPYWNPTQADPIELAISKLHSRLVDACCADKTSFGQRVRALTRSLVPPITPE